MELIKYLIESRKHSDQEKKHEAIKKNGKLDSWVSSDA